MPLPVTTLLRGILVVGFLVCLAAQIVVGGGLLFGDGTAPLPAKVVLSAAAVLGFACVQVAIVSVWRLVSLVRQKTVFSPVAFRWVDAIIAAIGGVAFFVLLAGYVVAEVDDAPGLILLSAVFSLLIAGVALIVYVQRMLLAQAAGFSAELEAVI
jgi:hypothetical protein